MNTQPEQAIDGEGKHPDNEKLSCAGVASRRSIIDHFVVQRDGNILPVYSTIPSTSAEAVVVLSMVIISGDRR